MDLNTNAECESPPPPASQAAMKIKLQYVGAVQNLHSMHREYSRYNNGPITTAYMHIWLYYTATLFTGTLHQECRELAASGNGKGC